LSYLAFAGMPGAFTPTCDKEHLPGYIKSADKLAALGIEKVAVVTTNDRFVNEAWSSQQGLLADNSIITILCDGDGDLVKSMGLADDMGFGVGIRSKRFVLVTNNGQVVELLTDEGMNDCSNTSAGNLVKLLTPVAVEESEGIEIDGKLIVGAGVALFAVVASQLGGSSAPPPAPPSTSRPAPQTRLLPEKKSAQSETTFSLLNQYLKD
jgi:glutaredoxin/glutathione-dependent peroxiredoxin